MMQLVEEALWKCADMTGQDITVTDNRILIGNDTVHEDIFTDNGILIQNAVFDNRTASDLDTAEQDAVFNGTVDGTTVCNQRVLDDRGIGITGGRRVSYLGKHGKILDAEELLAHVFVKQSH